MCISRTVHEDLALSRGLGFAYTPCQPFHTRNGWPSPVYQGKARCSLPKRPERTPLACALIIRSPQMKRGGDLADHHPCFQEPLYQFHHADCPDLRSHLALTTAIERHCDFCCLAGRVYVRLSHPVLRCYDPFTHDAISIVGTGLSDARTTLGPFFRC